MLGLDQVRRYAWADEDINLAWTLAVITGCTPANVVGAYGGDPGRSPEVMPFAKAQVPMDELGTYSLLQVWEVGDCVVAVENNGWRGQSAASSPRPSAENWSPRSTH